MYCISLHQYCTIDTCFYSESAFTITIQKPQLRSRRLFPAAQCDPRRRSLLLPALNHLGLSFDKGSAQCRLPVLLALSRHALQPLLVVTAEAVNLEQVVVAGLVLEGKE